MSEHKRMEARTSRNSVTVGLPNPRYRLISPDGKEYAAFRLKEGVKLSDITRANRGVGWDVEVIPSSALAATPEQIASSKTIVGAE